MEKKSKADFVSYELARFGHNVRIALRTVLNRFYISKKEEGRIVERFHKLYYDANLFGKTWRDTKWLGFDVAKCPMDLWLYQEIIYEVKPDVIVECGTLHGGSAAYMASLLDLMDHGRIITIDVRPREGRPDHPRITYLHGSSTADTIVDQVKRETGESERVMVILDSDHRMKHVLDELRIYRDIVTPGSYMIVEDTNLNGHPVAPEFGPGPMEALDAFLAEDDGFEVDKSKEKFYLSFNPRGYLRKKMEVH
jgi:cephalosporin hydroxylase